jgi:ABC-type oligopeptide transport system ATPase subunit
MARSWTRAKAAQIFDDPQTTYTKALMAAAIDLEATETGAVDVWIGNARG